MIHVNLKEIRREAMEINQRYQKGELNDIMLRYEMGLVFERIKDAMYIGQQFKQVKVRTPSYDRPLKALWIDERSPASKGEVVVLTVADLGRLAYFNN